MIRLLLVLLSATVSAGEASLLALPEAERPAAMRALLAPGRVVLAGGTTTLAAAIDALAAGGNRVVLADGLDDRREAPLPAFTGAWWEGVRVVCTAFALRFDEGIVSGDRLDGEGYPLPVGHGGLVLASDPSGPPPFTVVDAIAVVAETESRISADGRNLAVRVWSRAEPRLPRGRLAWGRVSEAQFRAGGGNLGLRPTGGDGNDTRPPALLLQAAIGQADPSTLSTFLAIRIGVLERWSVRSELRLGAQAQHQVAGQTLDVALHGEGSPALWQGIVMPERRPLLAIVGPEGLLGGCVVRLRSGGADVTSGAGGTNNAGGRNALFRFPRNLPDAPVEVIIEGNVAAAALDLPVTIPVGTRRQTTQPDPDVPTRLRWAAGSQPLSRWIAQLAAAGNTILPEVGIDTQTVVAVPAVDGCFWDGVVALCLAADLAPAPTAGSEIASGPLRLIRRQGRPLITSACGPLLVLAEAPAVVSDGSEREAHLRLSLLAEPRFAAERFRAPAIAWATYAEDSDGQPAQVLTTITDAETQPTARQRLLRNQPGAEDDPTTLVATVRVSRPQARSLTLAGLVMLQRSRNLRATAELAVGGAVEVVLGARPVELSTTGGPGGVTLPEVRSGSGILLRGVSGLENLGITATIENGAPIELSDGTGRMIPLGREPGLRLARCKLPESGNLTIELTAREQRPPLALPLRLVVPLP